LTPQNAVNADFYAVGTTLRRKDAVSRAPRFGNSLRGKMGLDATWNLVWHSHRRAGMPRRARPPSGKASSIGDWLTTADSEKFFPNSIPMSRKRSSERIVFSDRLMELSGRLERVETRADAETDARGRESASSRPVAPVRRSCENGRPRDEFQISSLSGSSRT